MIENAFSQREVEDMQEESNNILEFLINSSILNNRLSERLDLRRRSSGQQVIRKVQPINDISSVFSKMASDERLVNTLRMLMNDEPELMEEKLSYKQHLTNWVPGLRANDADDRFLIHNDWTYYQENGYQPSIITAAICIDDCPPESGPLHIWPGTHLTPLKHDTVQIVRNSYQIPTGLLNDSDSTDLTLQSGALIFFHSLLAHKSEPNLTDTPRRIIFFSYVPKTQSIGLDVRNGPLRKKEAPYEARFLSARKSGLCVDRYKLKPL